MSIPQFAPVQGALEHSSSNLRMGCWSCSAAPGPLCHLPLLRGDYRWVAVRDFQGFASAFRPGPPRDDTRVGLFPDQRVDGECGPFSLPVGLGILSAKSPFWISTLEIPAMTSRNIFRALSSCLRWLFPHLQRKEPGQSWLHRVVSGLCLGTGYRRHNQPRLHSLVRCYCCCHWCRFLWTRRRMPGTMIRSIPQLNCQGWAGCICQGG